MASDFSRCPTWTLRPNTLDPDRFTGLSFQGDPMRYEDFSLLLESPRDGVYPVIVRSPAGDGRGTFQIPPPSEESPPAESSQPSETTRDMRTKAPARVDPTQIGSLLFQALFSGSIRDLFERSLGRLENDGDAGLRIVVGFDPDQAEVGRLATLPWELLYRQDQR